MRFLFVAIAVVVIFFVSIAAWFFFVPEKRNFDSGEVAMPRESMAIQRVELLAKDGVKIVGDYYSAESPAGVLLLHMMPSDRKSWIAFAEKLQQAGFQALAIDLRGHGESGGPPISVEMGEARPDTSRGGPNGYRDFSDAEHQASRLDVEAGAEFLKSKGATEIHLAGASIGANLALQYLAEHSEAKSAILLSPGLDYRGVMTAPAMEKLREAQGVYFAAADDDGYSRDTVNELSGKISLDGRRMFKIFDRGGHGTKLFESHPEFMDELIDWLKNL